MTADRMTQEELLPAIAERVGDKLFAWLSSATGYDTLAVLLDPAELGKRWTPEQLTACLRGAEEARRAESEDLDAPYCSLVGCDVTHRVAWRIVPDEEEGT